MEEILLIKGDGLRWANPWSKHSIRAPGRDGEMQQWASAMHWFHAQSIANFEGADRIINKIRNVRGDRPARGNPKDKKRYKPKRELKDLVADQTAVKVDVVMQGNAGPRQTHAIREDWGKVWAHTLLMAMAYKFDQYPKLQKLLLETRTAIIVYDISEGTFGASNSDGQVVGGNKVGYALMQIREQLALRLELGDTSNLVEYPEEADDYDETIEMYDVLLERAKGFEPVKVEDCTPELQAEFADWLKENEDG